MTIRVPAQAYADAFAADPDLAPVLLAIAANESSYNPAAVGDGGTSYGYLQFHQGGGLGDGHDPAELLNGAANMRLGAAYLRMRLNAGATMWAALQPWSTRTADYALWQRMQTEGVAPDGDVSAATSAAGSGATAAPADGGRGLVGAAVLAALAILFLCLGVH